jgi:hypothetical protein
MREGQPLTRGEAMNSRMIFACLSTIWLLAIVARIVLFTGYMNGDMGNYIQEAHRVFEGRYSVKEYFQVGRFEDIVPTPNFNWQNLRLGLIVPVGLLFRFFGVSDLSYALYMLGCFTMGMIATYLLGKELHTPELGLTGALIYSFIPLEINLGTVLVPHIPAAAFTAVSCFFLLRALRIGGWGRAGALILSGSALGVAYLNWEVSLLMVPVLAAAMAARAGFKELLLTRRGWIDALSLAVGLALPILLEVLYFHSITGIFLFRQKFISAFGPMWIALNPVDKALLDWRIYPAALFRSYAFGLLYYLVAAGFGTWAYRRWAAPGSLEDSRMAFPIGWFAWLLLYMQFGSSSLTSYQPIFKMSHYLVVVSIPASLIAAYFLLSFPFDKVPWRLRAPRFRIPHVAAGLLGIFIVFSLGCAAVNFTGNGGFRRDITFEHRIKAALDRLPPGPPIVTDTWTKNGLDFVYGYERKILPFEYLGAGECYVVVNWIYIHSVYTMNTRFPGILYDPPGSWELKARVPGRTRNIDIYRIPLPAPEVRGSQDRPA